jgi:hypothetical protein
MQISYLIRDYFPAAGIYEEGIYVSRGFWHQNMGLIKEDHLKESMSMKNPERSLTGSKFLPISTFNNPLTFL